MQKERLNSAVVIQAHFRGLIVRRGTIHKRRCIVFIQVSYYHTLYILLVLSNLAVLWMDFTCPFSYLFYLHLTNYQFFLFVGNS